MIDPRPAPPARSPTVRALALDVGGTNVRMAIARVEPHSITIETQEHAATRDHRSLEAALSLHRSLFEGGQVQRASIAVAGPVVNGICHMTNLGWTVNARAIEASIGLPTRVINDFEAVARGVRFVPEDRLVTLQAGAPDPIAPVAILGAGTGLGEALLLHTPSGDHVMSTEGGHVDLAPRDDDDARLIAHIREGLAGGHVSVERVVSGAGLVAIFDWMVHEGATPSAALRASIERGGGAAAIGEAGVSGTDAVARAAVDRFVRFYGAEAGNLALKSLPRGGVFVAGGIAPKLLARIREGFLPAFLDKGRMRAVLETIPVHIIVDPDVGLRGAAAP